MRDQLVQLKFEVELQSGEKLTLPPGLTERIGPGRWIITVRPATSRARVRRHSAFLNGYAPEDEGLYDDDPSR